MQCQWKISVGVISPDRELDLSYIGDIQINWPATTSQDIFVGESAPYVRCRACEIRHQNLQCHRIILSVILDKISLRNPSQMQQMPATRKILLIIASTWSAPTGQHQQTPWLDG